MEKKPLVEAKNLCKTFKNPSQFEVLKNVCLEVFSGQSIAIMGASGEGKSTLLHILGTLEGSTSGSLKIAQKEVNRFNAANLRCHHIGFIFQAFNLLEDYTALQNALMPALIAKKEIHPTSHSYYRALELLEKVGLSHRLNYNVRLLSGGEKQRLTIARALCNNPDIILADEPSGNLDHANSHIIHELLINCAKELNKALIIVTHDDELARLCDQIYFLKNGTLHYSHLP